MGKVTGVQRYGVFFDLVGSKCSGLLRRERITVDKSLDLNAVYKIGDEVNLVVERIEAGNVVLALPPSAHLAKFPR